MDSYLNESHIDENSPLYFSSPAQTNHIEWTFEENKLFENAIAECKLDSPDLFQTIASKVPGKTIQQIKEHYEALVEDIEMIESGCVPLPDYKTTNNDRDLSVSTHQQRRKGVPWTKEEHEKFLLGLDMFGKGDWRSISRNCVLSKTPTQVASHAQKYFIRLEKSSAASKSATSTAMATLHSDH
ncbi:unnamed protein product [Ilex paraguariensis]|uniref:Uncharacterized protein n=1 Tax=Ilex paraguariensis TaxID=185542 RepID=A0ABC8R2Y5_9AQUA